MRLLKAIKGLWDGFWDVVFATVSQKRFADDDYYSEVAVKRGYAGVISMPKGDVGMIEEPAENETLKLKLGAAADALRQIDCYIASATEDDNYYLLGAQITHIQKIAGDARKAAQA